MNSRQDSRTLRFQSETSLAAFIRELPSDQMFHVEEDSRPKPGEINQPGRGPGRYTLYLD